MSPSYAETRLLEALKLSNGNLAKSRKLIADWCRQDQQLLYELCRPHMTGVIAHAMDRVLSNKFQSELRPSSGRVSTQEASRQASKTAPTDEDFGKELLKNFAMGQPIKFAQESFGAPIQKRKASQSHIDAIRRMAKKT